MIHFFYTITQFFLMLASLYAAIYGFIYKDQFKEMRFLYIYPAASFVETFTSPTINVSFPHLNKIGVPDMLVNSFLLIEILIIYQFYLQIFTSARMRIFLYTVLFTYVPTMILVWLIGNSFNKAEIFFVPQAICILIPGFYYFLELVKTPSTVELKSEPKFWVMLGIMLYFGCTLPLFLLDSLLDFSNLFEKNVFAINSICYGILYLLMIKAFLCKTRKAP